MNNINDVRKNLALLFSDLKNGKIEHQEAKELNNCAGKIINSCKVQLEYQKYRGGRVSIKFLNGA